MGRQRRQKESVEHLRNSSFLPWASLLLVCLPAMLASFQRGCSSQEYGQEQRLSPGRTVSRPARGVEGGAVGVRGQGQPTEGLECQAGLDGPLRAGGGSTSAWPVCTWSVSRGSTGLAACKVTDEGGPCPPKMVASFPSMARSICCHPQPEAQQSPLQVK